MVIKKKMQEDILVVPRVALNGLLQHGVTAASMGQVATIIGQNKLFKPRFLMETDPTYKQVIPYLVFTCNDKLFLMQRKETASEQRLKGKYSLGIGGHIRQEDMTSDSLFDWAQREFHEEVNYTGRLQIEAIGLLNDDTDEVGNVHVGYVLLLRGDLENITIRSELKSGQLLTYDECQNYYAHMETWSQMVFSYLINQKIILTSTLSSVQNNQLL